MRYNGKVRNATTDGIAMVTKKICDMSGGYYKVIIATVIHLHDRDVSGYWSVNSYCDMIGYRLKGQANQKLTGMLDYVAYTCLCVLVQICCFCCV